MFGLLRQHPEIAVSFPKELYYFCTDFREESDRHHGRPMRFHLRLEADYLSRFADRSRRFVAEGTPAYLYSTTAAQNIRRFNPDARIIALVRNPVDMLHSFHSKLLTFGHETIEDFRQALDAEPARRAGRELPRGLFWPSSLYYSDWIKFGQQIERYRRVFPSEQIKVVVHEDFKNDNGAMFDEVVAFLGLEPFRPESKRINENTVVRSRLASRALTIVGDMPGKHLVPVRLRRALRWRLLKANRKPAARVALDPVLRHELMQRFRPDVEDLSRVLNRDLVSLWGYDR